MVLASIKVTILNRKDITKKTSTEAHLHSTMNFRSINLKSDKIYYSQSTYSSCIKNSHRFPNSVQTSEQQISKQKKGSVQTDPLET